MDNNQEKPKRQRMVRPQMTPEQFNIFMEEVKKDFTGETGFLNLPVRAVTALEKIAYFFENNIVLFRSDGSVHWGGVSHEAGGKGDNQETDDETGPGDQGIAERQPDGTIKCTDHSSRYGYDALDKRAVCSIKCSRNLICKIPHRTFDDLGERRGDLRSYAETPKDGDPNPPGP